MPRQPPAPNRPTGRPKYAGPKQRPRGRAFQKGHKKLGGRKKGTGNFVTTELKLFFKEFYATPEYQRSLQRRLLDGKAPAVELNGWHTVIGKPRETHQISADTLDHLYALAAAKGLGSREESEEAGT